MFRPIYYLVLTLFSHALIAAPHANNYVKQGAPVTLISPSYTLQNSDQPQNLALKLRAAKPGQMQLRYSASNGVNIVDAATTRVDISEAQTQINLPITVSAEPNTKGYVNIFVTFTDHNGALSSRALSAIVNTGQVVASKPSTSPPAVISMRAIETISSNE